MSNQYYNPKTHQTAIVKDSKADKDGNICVLIDGVEQVMGYNEFIHSFHSMTKEYQNDNNQYHQSAGV